MRSVGSQAVVTQVRFLNQALLLENYQHFVLEGAHRGVALADLMGDAVQIGQLGEIDLQIASILASWDFPDVEDHNVAHPHDDMLSVGVPDTSVVKLASSNLFQQIMELLLD